MRPSRHLLRLVGCAVLFALDALLAHLCVEIDAAGALLSPGAAVPLQAFAAAGGFLLVRLSLVLGLAGTAGIFVGELVGLALGWLFPDRGVEGSGQGSR